MLIVCDFDDTTADLNVATLLLTQFQSTRKDHSTPHWTVFRDRFRSGQISLMQYQELSFSWLSPNTTIEAEYVKTNANLRPGFKELADYCERNTIPLVISSHGLDFYIAALLSRYGLEYLPRSTVSTAFTEEGVEFRYPNAKQGCDWWPGNCKCEAFRAHGNDGDVKIYAGDGASDACPARAADIVFARDFLLDYCRENEIPNRELVDFHVLLDYVKSLNEQSQANQA
jgi:2-hydroxy-3-keto-5-methylthiopentenyl-1-phosphate phosphatase